MRLRGGRTGVRALTCVGLALAGLARPFDLEVFYGERVAVLGGNGSGGLRAFHGTVLAVTHDRWFARSFDRYVVFGADGTVREVRDAETELAALDRTWCDRV
jgi:hypothetical protein